jgi:hypothetical protein
MRIFLTLLLFASLSQAQVQFGPLRLDDFQSGDRYYPRIQESPAGDLLCIWARASDTQLVGYGRHITYSGEPADTTIIYEDMPVGAEVCPPAVQVVPLPGGGEAQLIQHA